MASVGGEDIIKSGVLDVKTPSSTFFRGWRPQVRLTYDHPNGFPYLQLGGDFINLFLFKTMAF